MIADLKIPPTIAWLQSNAAGKDWLDQLPLRLSNLCRTWHLDITGSPIEGGSVSLVVPVRCRVEQRDLILKLQWPHAECKDEAAALKVWNGEGAIQLIRHSEPENALLLELCKPGTYLADEPVDHISILAEMLPRLWKRTEHAFQRLDDEARLWIHKLEQKLERPDLLPVRGLIEQAIELGKELVRDVRCEWLVHQDLHGHNILKATREPWLAIDPKPLLGEKEFALASIIRSFEFGHSKPQALDRLNQLSDRLGLDRDRARNWTILQTTAWSADSSYAEVHLQTVKWLLEERI